MRISYVARSTVPSRTANSIHAMRMSAAYASLGHSVSLVLPRFRAWEERGIQDLHGYYGVPADFRIRRLPSPRSGPLSSLALGLLLPAVAAAGRPHFVHCRSLGACWGLTRAFRLPTLLELHRPPPAGRPRHLLQGALASGRVVGVVVITEALARLMREHVPASVPLIVEPDAVEAAWVESELSQEDARRGLGLSEEHRSIVVYTGHLYAGRGIELVLEAARSLPRHLFMLAGGGDAYVESTRRLAADLDNVEVVGFVPPATVFAYLRAADVLIMPYGRSIAVSGGGDTAAFASPLKMFEYMAAGRPLLSSDLPVLREVLADGVNCRLLPPDEPTAWVAALTELTEKPETGMAWGERARSDAARYTWRARASRLVDRVSELIR